MTPPMATLPPTVARSIAIEIALRGLVAALDADGGIASSGYGEALARALKAARATLDPLIVWRSEWGTVDPADLPGTAEYAARASAEETQR
jgi:hypothetical protein